MKTYSEREETIVVNHGDSVTVRVRTSHYGVGLSPSMSAHLPSLQPVISDHVDIDGAAGRDISLRWM